MRTAEELRKASGHLWYEIWMFQSLVAGMSSGIAGTGVINNAILESFAVHVRVLIHFFYADRRQSDDVVAEDFFSDSNVWRNERPTKTMILEKAKKRADKEIAHLTYTRQKVTPEEKTWNILPIYNDLQNAIQKFLDIVPRSLLSPEWQTLEKQNGIQDDDPHSIIDKKAKP